MSRFLKNTTLASLSLAALFACSNEVPTATGEFVRTGNIPITVDEAIEAFQKVCMLPRPTFVRSDAVIRNLGNFRKEVTNTTINEVTYYDQARDFSFQITPNRVCSMYFATREGREDVMSRLNNFSYQIDALDSNSDIVITDPIVPSDGRMRYGFAIAYKGS